VAAFHVSKLRKKHASKGGGGKRGTAEREKRERERERERSSPIDRVFID
jgi:hypothetical protein